MTFGVYQETVRCPVRAGGRLGRPPRGAELQSNGSREGPDSGWKGQRQSPPSSHEGDRGAGGVDGSGWTTLLALSLLPFVQVTRRAAWCGFAIVSRTVVADCGAVGRGRAVLGGERLLGRRLADGRAVALWRDGGSWERYNRTMMERWSAWGGAGGQDERSWTG